MQNIIVPAIIAKNQTELNRAIRNVSKFAKRIQIDVMDGKFVKNVSNNFDLSLIREPEYSGEYEIHLMVSDPLHFVYENVDKFDRILVHVETINDKIFDEIFDIVKSKDLLKKGLSNELFQKVRSKTKELGLAINPETDLKELSPYIQHIDFIQIMTVHPGQYGAEFIPETLSKIMILRKFFKKDIQVDGGINQDTILECKKAGANVFVSGGFIVKSDYPEDNYKKLKQNLSV